MHGGASTGPRTPEGLARSKKARWKHGRYSAERLEQYRQVKAEYAQFNRESAVHHAALVAAMKGMLREQRREIYNLRRRKKRRLRARG